MALSPKYWSKKHAVITALFVVGLVASLTAMQLSYDSGNRHMVFIYGDFSAVLLILSTLSIWIQATSYVGRKKRAENQVQEKAINPHEYCATYSFRARLTYSLLTVGFTILSMLVCVRPQHLQAKVLMCSMMLCCAVSAYRALFTAVVFSEKGIMVVVKFVRSYSEPYKAITAIYSRPGNLQIKFEGGRKLNLPSELGNPRQIATILERHVETLPEKYR